MTDTRATIERLRELYAKASADSPGEWMPTHDLDSEDTAIYIAESHNFLPALLDRLEKLERVAAHSRCLDKELEEHVQAGDIPPLAEIYDVREALDELDK